MHTQLVNSIVLLSLLVLTSGCAEKGPILIEGIKYQTPEGVSVEKGRAVVAVSPFRDMRDKSAKMIGQRQVRDHLSNDLVVQDTATDMVAQAFSDALRGRGIAVTQARAWDLSEALINAADADILVGGEIKTLWIDVATQPFKVKYKATVHLRVSVAEVKDRKIIRTLKLNSSLEREDVSYSDYTVQETIAEALSSAINQLLNDEEFKKRIH